MTNDKSTFESIKEVFSRQSDEYSITDREPPDSRMDWDRESTDPTTGEMHYEEDGFWMEKEIDSPRLSIHVTDGLVHFICDDMSTDDWQSCSFKMPPEGIDELIEQLECAKEYVESGSADIRT